MGGEHLTLTHNKVRAALGAAVAWSSGKDSTVVLDFARDFDPDVPVYFVDSHEFQETYDYVKWCKKEWKLNLKVIRQEAIMIRGEIVLFERMTPDSLYDIVVEDFPDVNKNLLYWMATKIIPINEQINEDIMTGMRWDEDIFRQFLDYEEEFMGHVSDTKPQKRHHPILHWSEFDVHEYLRKNGIRKNPLYHMGYRSIGDRMTTTKGDGKTERGGRQQDLKTIIYMAAIGYLQSKGI